mgnify:CR=1 FL=1
MKTLLIIFTFLSILIAISAFMYKPMIGEIFKSNHQHILILLIILLIMAIIEFKMFL